MVRISVAFLVLSCLCPVARAADALTKMEWRIDGTPREALVHIPPAAKSTATPVIFAFHGHGGMIKGFSAKFAAEKHWPDAICVYPQGLATATPRDPNGEKPGWKTDSTDNNRDLKLFDAMLASLKENCKVDEKRIYSTGFSNGSGFTMFLWANRGDLLAAVAPIAGGTERFAKEVKPKPAMVVAGEKDPLVPIASQKSGIEMLQKLNGCESTGDKWTNLCTFYPSKSGTPLVSYIHPGAHMVPEDAPALIVKFFKEQTRK